MKLNQLFEEEHELDVGDARLEWLWEAFPENNNPHFNDGDWYIKDNKIVFDPEVQLGTTSQRTMMRMEWDGEIPHPMGEFHGSLYCNGKLTSLKNAPTKVTRAFVLANNEIEKIDHPIDANLLRLNGNKIKSVVGIHKFIKCRIIVIDDNPVEGSILDILKIPNLDEVDTTISSVDNPLSRAMEIIHKYTGQGNAGIIKAQRELIENDLEDFA